MGTDQRVEVSEEAYSIQLSHGSETLEVAGLSNVMVSECSARLRLMAQCCGY